MVALEGKAILGHNVPLSCGIREHFRSNRLNVLSLIAVCQAAHCCWLKTTSLVEPSRTGRMCRLPGRSRTISAWREHKVTLGPETLVSDRTSTSLNNGRQATAVATAFLLPISTTGTAISIAALTLVTLLSTSVSDWLSALRSPAATIPIALFACIAASMLWSPQPLGPGGVSHYTKLLLIPLIMANSFTSRQAVQIAYGFLAGCIILLTLSFASLLWPSGPWEWFKAPGVPVKDNAVQSICFALCAFGLSLDTVQRWRSGRKAFAVAAGAFAFLFFTNVFVIYFSKTGILISAALATLFLVRTTGWRLSFAIVMPLLVVVVAATLLSGRAQQRIAEISSDILALESGSSNMKTSISTASRIDFWRKALDFIGEAPLVGHGAGSTKSLYSSLETERPSPYGEAVPDPHNQLLAIAIQTGLLGGALLITMWVAHFMAFLGGGLPQVFGQAIVLQAVLSSLFNSSLSQVTEGTLYCLAVGLLAGLIQRSSRTKKSLACATPRITVT